MKAVWFGLRKEPMPEPKVIFYLIQKEALHKFITDSTDGNSNYGTAFKSFNSDGFLFNTQDML
jgi:hypothetical protein